MGHDLRNMTKDDLLARVGLEARRSSASHLAFALELFGLGLLVGAGIALLLTPKSGRELRDDIKSRLGQAPDGDAAAGTRSRRKDGVATS
jgi:hypothetical protein